MTALIILLILILLTVIIIQVSKVSELSAKIRGEEEAFYQGNDRTGLWMFIFMIVFLVACVVSAIYYKNIMLGYGPLQSASAHGGSIDSLFNVTLFFTGIVFVITHILLFWFTYKYRARRGGKADFFPHNTNLEIIWTVIPAIVMTFLVVKGLVVWNDVMPDVDPNDTDYIEIEATGYQFGWDLRYPGADGKLGTRDFTQINLATNPLGQVWTDSKNQDDFMPSEIVLPRGKKVRVRIIARDVLHNFYLPHFRVKMDAIPGLPTYFIFTPVTTTEEFREELKKYPEWQLPADPDDPESGSRAETFEYELACAELCGKGHYSMRRLVKIVEQEEYDAWLAEQQSYYLTNIRGTDADPNLGKLLGVEIANRNAELEATFAEADENGNVGDIISLKNVFFKTGSSSLTDNSKYELNKVAELLNKYSTMTIEVGGHTDSTGSMETNKTLSEARAISVLSFLTDKGVTGGRLTANGYGPDQPVGDNATDEGRQQNRRTELKIISK